MLELGLDVRKPVFGGLRITRADQPADPRSLISTFVIPFLESIISRLAASEISNFWIVCVPAETGLSCDEAHFISGYWVGYKLGTVFSKYGAIFRYFEVSLYTYKYIVLCYCKYVQYYLFLF